MIYPMELMGQQAPAIRGFRGDYEFLSNFYPSEISYEGIKYKTVGHAYQAAKSSKPDIRLQIAALPTPGKAKRYGQKISPLPDGWFFSKYQIMKKLLLLKFADPVLAQQLLDTGDALLEETNFWGDTDWGVCNGVGQNRLGFLLMEVRTMIDPSNSSKKPEPAF